MTSTPDVTGRQLPLVTAPTWERKEGKLRGDHAALAKVGTTWLWGAPFCYVAWEAEETLLGRKGVKGLLLVGHEKVPHGFGLTGDCGGNTADGAGNRGAT